MGAQSLLLLALLWQVARSHLVYDDNSGYVLEQLMDPKKFLEIQGKITDVKETTDTLLADSAEWREDMIKAIYQLDKLKGILDDMGFKCKDGEVKLNKRCVYLLTDTGTTVEGPQADAKNVCIETLMGAEGRLYRPPIPPYGDDSFVDALADFDNNGDTYWIDGEYINGVWQYSNGCVVDDSLVAGTYTDGLCLILASPFNSAMPFTSASCGESHRALCSYRPNYVLPPDTIDFEPEVEDLQDIELHDLFDHDELV